MKLHQMTQLRVMWHAAILLLCLAQLTQAVTTAKPKTLVQATQPTSTTTTVKSRQQQQQPAQTQQKKQDPKCLQPLEIGPCRMSLERYYYNKDKNACETFKYGGCRGNDNRWGFQQTCEEACLIRK
ncbi:kunitz-type protease inhibitor 2 [Drosophila nasuta]|uniref:kunitz-type protease inhibitor 2 n=1 Tax=Drosophila nasuta TaxID=42062 RepID=UPI00295EDEEB|nr:kunitz-type protease inhibitor 2 [Drosophila nasuta]